MHGTAAAMADKGSAKAEVHSDFADPFVQAAYAFIAAPATSICNEGIIPISVILSW